MTEDSPIYLVDDDEAVRRATSFMLRTSGHVVKTFVSGVEFLDQVAGLELGCVLLDVRMPEMDGLEVQAELRKLNIDFPVVIMTGHGDVAIAVEAMKAGAVDFIEKPFEKAVLLEAIDQALGRMRDKARAGADREQAKALLRVLTPREMDVLDGLARGHPNKTIAYDLGISPRTVEVHRANLMLKLDAASLSETLRIAFAAGLGTVQS